MWTFALTTIKLYCINLDYIGFSYSYTIILYRYPGCTQVQLSGRTLVHWETLTYRTGKDCWEAGTATGWGRVKGQDALQCFRQSTRKRLPIWPPQPGWEWGWCDWRRGGRWLGRARQSRSGRKAGHANRHATTTTTGERLRRLETKEGNCLLTTMEHEWHKKNKSQITKRKL